MKKVKLIVIWKIYMYSFPTETYTGFFGLFYHQWVYLQNRKKKHETMINPKLKPKQLPTDKAQTCDVVMGFWLPWQHQIN